MFSNLSSSKSGEGPYLVAYGIKSLKCIPVWWLCYCMTSSYCGRSLFAEYYITRKEKGLLRGCAYLSIVSLFSGRSRSYEPSEAS